MSNPKAEDDEFRKTYSSKSGLLNKHLEATQTMLAKNAIINDPMSLVVVKGEAKEGDYDKKIVDDNRERVNVLEKKKARASKKKRKYKKNSKKKRDSFSLNTGKENAVSEMDFVDVLMGRGVMEGPIEEKYDGYKATDLKNIDWEQVTTVLTSMDDMENSKGMIFDEENSLYFKIEDDPAVLRNAFISKFSYPQLSILAKTHVSEHPTMKSNSSIAYYSINDKQKGVFEVRWDKIEEEIATKDTKGLKHWIKANAAAFVNEVRCSTLSFSVSRILIKKNFF